MFSLSFYFSIPILFCWRLFLHLYTAIESNEPVSVITSPTEKVLMQTDILTNKALAGQHWTLFICLLLQFPYISRYTVTKVAD